MSQRTPSHCPAMLERVSITAERNPWSNAFNWSTSGQAGKYGSRPQANTLSPMATKERGSAFRSSSFPWMKYAGCSRTHG